MFIMHLIVDGYEADYQKLIDLDFIYNILDVTPEKISMTKIMPPYVFKYHGKNPEDWGLSGFVLIAESHISIHTFPEKRYLNIDIFSCKVFDSEAAIKLMKDNFSINKTQIKLLERGIEYPHNIEKASNIVSLERCQLQATKTS
ncbi:MAG: adenosylmethionine decarboxylase [bacterium]